MSTCPTLMLTWVIMDPPTRLPITLPFQAPLLMRPHLQGNILTINSSSRTIMSVYHPSEFDDLLLVNDILETIEEIDLSKEALDFDGDEYYGYASYQVCSPLFLLYDSSRTIDPTRKIVFFVSLICTAVGISIWSPERSPMSSVPVRYFSFLLFLFFRSNGFPFPLPFLNLLLDYLQCISLSFDTICQDLTVMEAAIALNIAKTISWIPAFRY